MRIYNSLLVILIAIPVSACRSEIMGFTDPLGEGTSELRSTIDDLYEAFCFDAESEPDWEMQRWIFLEGAIFVPPMRGGSIPTAQSADEFQAEFRSFVIGEAYSSTGFYERIIEVRIHEFGDVAQACVTFEGFFPGETETQTRGVDVIQFVYDGESWRLVSFATQYEREGLRLPAPSYSVESIEPSGAEFL